MALRATLLFINNVKAVEVILRPFLCLLKMKGDCHEKQTDQKTKDQWCQTVECG